MYSTYFVMPRDSKHFYDLIHTYDSSTCVKDVLAAMHLAADDAAADGHPAVAVAACRGVEVIATVMIPALRAAYLFERDSNSRS